METARQLQAANRQELTSYLKPCVPGLTEQENKIIGLKYASKPVIKMTDAELVKAVPVLMLKIHVITGWPVPQKEFSAILADQLVKKFRESYQYVNMEEVEYAFRNSGVKDWGKEMNLNLIDEVMTPYLSIRFQLSQAEEQAQRPKEIAYEPIAMTDEQLLTAAFETYKVLKNYNIIPESVYFYLEGTGKIILTNEQKNEIRRGLPVDVFESNVKATCRKIAVADYFNKLIADALPKP